MLSRLEPSTKIILKVFVGVVALALLWFVRDIIVIVLLSLVLASALEPLVDHFQQKKVPRVVSVLTVYLLFLGVVLSVSFSIFPALVSESRTVIDNLPDYIDQAKTSWPLLAVFLQGVDGSDVLSGIIRNISGESGSIFSGTIGVFSGLFTIVTVMVVSFYLVSEQKNLVATIGELVPSSHQEFTLQLIAKIQKKMGQWVLGQLILSASIFLLSYAVLLALGVKYALLLAILAGVLEVVPYIGPIISGLPAIFFALLQSPSLALFVLISYVAIQKLEGYILVPKIMQKTIGVSPLTVLISLLIGFKLGGVLGLLLAVPLAAALSVVIQEVNNQRNSY